MTTISRTDRIAQERDTLPVEARGYFDTLMTLPPKVRLYLGAVEIRPEDCLDCIVGHALRVYRGVFAPSPPDGTDRCAAMVRRLYHPGGMWAPQQAFKVLPLQAGGRRFEPGPSPFHR